MTTPTCPPSTLDAARAERARAMLPMVSRIARGLARRLPAQVDLDDLVSAGHVGLAAALTRLEPDDCAWFDAYAIQRIRGAMIDQLRVNDPLTRQQRRRARRVAETERALTAELGRAPEPEEIASAASLSAERYWESARLAQTRQAHEVETDGGVPAALHVTAPPWAAVPESAEDAVLRRERRDLVLERGAALSLRLRTVLEWYYRDDMTLREIGDRMGVTEARVSQLRTDAIRRLRAACAERTPPRRASSKRRPARPRLHGARARGVASYAPAAA